MLMQFAREQRMAVAALDVRDVFPLVALFGKQGEKSEGASPVLSEVGDEGLEALRLCGELGLALKPPGVPAIGAQAIRSNE